MVHNIVAAKHNRVTATEKKLRPPLPRVLLLIRRFRQKQFVLNGIIILAIPVMVFFLRPVLRFVVKVWLLALTHQHRPSKTVVVLGLRRCCSVRPCCCSTWLKAWDAEEKDAAATAAATTTLSSVLSAVAPAANHRLLFRRCRRCCCCCSCGSSPLSIIVALLLRSFLIIIDQFLFFCFFAHHFYDFDVRDVFLGLINPRARGKRSLLILLWRLRCCKSHKTA